MERHSPLAGASSSSSPPPTDPVALCKADEHLMSVAPGWKPMDKTELDRLLSVMGATEGTREDYLRCFNLAAQEVIDRGGVRVSGRKPQPDDPGVYTVLVPNSDHVIRMWDGGMGPYGQFCLDFYDVKRKASVNLPAGYSLHPATMPAPRLGPGYPPAGFPVPMNSSPFMLAGQLRSWERNQGMDSIPEGEERWSIPDGMYIMLRREGHPDFTFQMPTRQIAPFAVAQPQLGRTLDLQSACAPEQYFLDHVLGICTIEPQTTPLLHLRSHGVRDYRIKGDVLEERRLRANAIIHTKSIPIPGDIVLGGIPTYERHRGRAVARVRPRGEKMYTDGGTSSQAWVSNANTTL